MSRVVHIRDLFARPLERVLPKWEKLLAFIRARDVIVRDPGALVSVSNAGTRVTLSTKAQPSTPFRVSISGRAVRVRPGYVDGHMPTVEKIALDGTNADGEREVRPFTFELPEQARPGPDGRSFVCLRMLWDEGKQAPRDAEEDWLSVAHVSDLKQAREDDAGTVVWEPLAVVYWRADAVERVGQLVRHNLVYFAIPAGDGQPGRVYFSAV